LDLLICLLLSGFYCFCCIFNCEIFGISFAAVKSRVNFAKWAIKVDSISYPFAPKFGETKLANDMIISAYDFRLNVIGVFLVADITDKLIEDNL
jgi:hypothetical protein